MFQILHFFVITIISTFVLLPHQCFAYIYFTLLCNYLPSATLKKKRENEKEALQVMDVNLAERNTYTNKQTTTSTKD